MTFSKVRNDKSKTKIAKESALELHVRNKLHSKKAHIADAVLKYLKPKLNQRLPYGSGPAIMDELKKVLQEPWTAETRTPATSVSFGQLKNQWIKNTNNNSNSFATSSTNQALSADSQLAVTVHNLLHHFPSDLNACVPPLTSPSLSPVDSNPGPRSNAESPNSPSAVAVLLRITTREHLRWWSVFFQAGSLLYYRSWLLDSIPQCSRAAKLPQTIYVIAKVVPWSYAGAPCPHRAKTEIIINDGSSTIACPRQSGENEPDMVELFRVAEDITDWIVELSRYTEERVDCVERR